MPELPDARANRFVKQYGLPLYDAKVLIAEKALADFFEQCAKAYHDPKKISNWMMGDLLRRLHEKDIDIHESKITPEHLVKMVKLIDDGVISGKIAKKVIRIIVETGKTPEEIVEEEELIRITSEKLLEKMVAEVFERHQKAVEDALKDEKAAHFLVGELMRTTDGKADPPLANRIVKRKLKEVSDSGV
jgi:aspartyl-tRNA(Asn)/glutamyl-tRNA(Gln) amidotransferase subunit B